MDVAFLNSIGLWDSLCELIEAAGWTEFLSFTFPIYEWLCWDGRLECLLSRLPCLHQISIFQSRF